MNNLTPLEKIRSLGLIPLNEDFANFPIIILDYYAPDHCLYITGNDILAQHT